MDPVKYPADMLANGGPPFDTMGLRALLDPLDDYAAVTLVFGDDDHARRIDTAWKVVAGKANTVVAEGELTDMLQYMFDYGCRVESLAGKANS